MSYRTLGIEEAALGECWGPVRDLRTQLADTVKFIAGRTNGDLIQGVVRQALDEDLGLLIRKGKGLGLPVIGRIETLRNAEVVSVDDLQKLCIWTKQDWSVYDQERLSAQ